jgi:Flp pilus assembly protein TadG
MFIKFLKDCRASVAPILAICIFPLIGAVGWAVDYTRASAARTAFQGALDSTALTLSKTAAVTPTDDALSAAATAYVNAVFTRPDTTVNSVHAHYTTDGGSKVTVSGTATINTNFLRILGFDHIDIATTTTSTWGNTRLRVALVLDNTGSMTETGQDSNVTKMAALKTASHDLLAQLHTAAANNPENVYVSIVPFSKDVNVGSSNNAASWLYWDDGVTTADNYWDALNGSCNRTGSAFSTRSKCLAVNVCSKSKYTTQTNCTSNSGTWYTTAGTWTPAAHSTWNGCVTDRDQNFDTTNDAADAGGTRYPAEQYGSCSASLLQLTNNWDNLSAKVDDMKAVGNTNQAIGLQVGWQTLTAAPFTVPAKDPHYNYKQVVILLTDGLNTADRWFSCPTHGPCPTIDARQQLTCNNIKAAGIEIYAVQVDVAGSDNRSPLLETCASDTSKFYYLTSTSSIGTTFNQIGTAISNLRLAQ